MTSLKNYLLALASAFLMWLAWPPHANLSPLLLVGLVPLFFALNNIDKTLSPTNGKRVFLTAGICFLGWNTACIYWVYNAISAYNNALVSFLVSLIPYGLGALLMTFAFWLAYQLKKRTNKWLGYAGLVAFYLAMEFLHQSWDLAFPWMTLGNGFATNHQFVQWYSFTGVYGGSLWILLSNILVFESITAITKAHKKRWFWIAWAIFVMVAPVIISKNIYGNYQEKGMPVNVVVVQPNIDPYEKNGIIPPEEQLQILTKLSDSVAQPNTEYFIWPETAMPRYTNEDGIRNNADFLQMQHFLEKYKNGTLITGIESVKHYYTKQTLSAKGNAQQGYFDHFNAAMQAENSANVQFYHKSKLVPGVEKMPFPKFFAFLTPVFAHFGGSTGGYGWQNQPSVFYAQSGIGVAPVICYESIWGNWIAQSVKEGAQLIAIITNDGWWGNTAGKDQHLHYAKLRALENRRYVVRSANTGISAIINQRGDIVAQSKWWQRTAINANVNLNNEQTFYAQHGDWIAHLACLAALVFALVIIVKKYRFKTHA